ncbi:terminase large subunit domain-containing protein [Halarsenatibacter silvermanii]|uniref:Terminase large subunit gp17-like C-terminal domain-containing protein n=1 Tax=Halarsenatibacter silvermanii TaxID=321763 RepID=A0A1G9RAM4_9FIRM|nr:terminase family protein [Halarsenatibacter silvermanii]SDM20278.1 hypothetical protein SAMN04488692_12119 [Halarsenatibacter silvermanii]
MELTSNKRDKICGKIIKQETKRLAARDKLKPFLEFESKGVWKTADHLEYMCEKLEAVERGEIDKLMIFMPPRHGKSEVASKKFPAWYLGRHPDREIILTSYAADLAYDFSRIARNTLWEQGLNIFGKELASDSKAVKKWNIEGYRGGLAAAGVGGPITGRGADVAIIDDPVKNWEEAASEVYREKVWNWYQTVLRTRLSPGGAIVLIMTRWHEDDLAGRLLEREAKKWEIINFPAIAEEKDILGREIGEVLWPDRYPQESIMDIKGTMLDRLFASLYQQKPRKDIENALWNYNMIQRSEKPGNFARIVVAVDPPASNSDTSSEAGIIAAGIDHEGQGYILEDRSLKASPGGWGKAAVKLYHELGADRIVAEINNGGDMVEHVIRSVDPMVSYKSVRASRGKSIRAEPIAALYEQKPPKVYHAGKFEKLENQMTCWVPGDESPDRLDALVWALSELMFKSRGGGYYTQNFA